ncbi:hypothetical protein niasHT_030033 [Heterodera trifolii]|uniref:Uncharacterized protein n=1 Tax=Heterodera trifolii TaxID=157864 RepID=A0ABD2JQU0_9BILA
MKRNFAKRSGGPPSHLKRMAANVATDLMKNYFTPSGIFHVPNIGVLAAAATDGGGETTANGQSDEIVAVSAPAVTTKSAGGGKTAATNTNGKRRAPTNDKPSRNEEAPTTEVVLDLSDGHEENREPRRKRGSRICCGPGVLGSRICCGPAAKRRAGYRHWRANGGGGGSSAQQPFTFPGPMTAPPFNYNNNFPQMAPVPCMMMMMPVMPMGMPFCPYPPPPPKN